MFTELFAQGFGLVLLACLLLGSIAGFLAGLFGIGGGLIIVPTLVWLFPMLGIEDGLLMSLALGTSFATIIFTTFSAAQRHHKLGNVEWRVVKIFIPLLMLGVFLGGQIASGLPKALMSKIFAGLVVFLALKMLISVKQTVGNKPLTTPVLAVGGAVIGVLSSFAGIAGGAFTVPFLNGRGIEMKKAIGTSSLCGCLLGIAGTASYILAGLNQPNLPAFSLGYVYLPALVAIVATSFFTSKLGANAANKLPVPILKKAFAVLLIGIAINMFLK